MLTLQPTACAPVLLLAAGNLSRGDDALGPLLAERIEALALPQVEVKIEFQFQVENALDLSGRRAVYFIDAAAAGGANPDPVRLHPAPDSGCCTHALAPSAVLHCAQRLGIGLPDETYLVAIRGYEFGLGKPLSPAARANLDAAFERLAAQLTAEPAALMS